MKNYRTLPGFLIVVSIILCSCGASHKLTDDMIYKDAGFSYSHLKNSGMVICGISSQLIQLAPAERIKYGSLLSNVFVEKLKGAQNIHVINMPEFMTRIGKEKYFEIMHSFDLEKTVQPETVRFIRDTMPGANYILFAYIENENIIDRSVDQYIENEEGKEELETQYEKTYLLTVEFQLFDVLQEKLVLNNVLYNQAKRSESRTTGTGCVESCTSNIFQNILFGEPAEIDREEVLAKISEKFAKDLVKI